MFKLRGVVTVACVDFVITYFTVLNFISCATFE